MTGTDNLTVGIDYRPALVPGFGIGRYVDNLVRALLAADDSVRLRLYGVFLRNRRKILARHEFPADPRAQFRGVPLPARVVPWLAKWTPLDARVILGDIDVFHDTDYAVTPIKKRPRIATIHDAAYVRGRGFVSEDQSERMRSIVERLLDGVSHVLTVSEFSKQDLVEVFGLDPARVTVTHLGVDPLFRSERDPERSRETLLRYDLPVPYVLYMGSIEPRKNLVRLARAFARLLEVSPEHRLVLVGRRGYGHERVFGVIEELGISDRVHVLGCIPDLDVLDLLHEASVLAYPSLYEGFGLPALEGMAAGTPVLSSDRDALREVCGDGALLVDPRDEGQIFDGLRTLTHDRGEALDIAERGRHRSIGFTWQRCAERTLAAYRAALES